MGSLALGHMEVDPESARGSVSHTGGGELWPPHLVTDEAAELLQSPPPARGAQTMNVSLVRLPQPRSPCASLGSCVSPRSTFPTLSCAAEARGSCGRAFGALALQLSLPGGVTALGLLPLPGLQGRGRMLSGALPAGAPDDCLFAVVFT